MAIIANTYKTYEAKGIREDLSNVIYDISPEDTPFMSKAGRGKASQTLFEWQTDALAAAVTTNKQLEGDDVASFTAVTPSVRLGNYVQISRKDVIISGTLEAVDKAGRKSEEAYQMARKSVELKRDMESTLLSNQAANAGAAGTARATAGLIPFLKTNTNFNTSDGVDPVYTTVPTDDRTDGTQRTFTEAMLKDAIQQCWTEGASPSLILAGAFNKTAISAFAGVYSKTFNTSAAKPGAIVAAADVYVSDFGVLKVIPSRFQRARDVFVLDMEYASVSYLRPFKREMLAKTGDAEKRMINVEWGLKVHNEKAHGAIFDLNTA
jgi:hypothetical protein